MSYRTITSGKNKRREYLAANRSPLFEGLPKQDYAREQKTFYSKLLYERLPQLLSFYFPAEFSDYNNTIKVNIENIECREPEITVKNSKGKDITKLQSEEEARADSLT